MRKIHRGWISLLATLVAGGVFVAEDASAMPLEVFLPSLLSELPPPMAPPAPPPPAPPMRAQRAGLGLCIVAQPETSRATRASPSADCFIFTVDPLPLESPGI